MWALFTTLCIILVIAVYYKYKTRKEGFAGPIEGFLSGVDWFGQTVENVIEAGQLSGGVVYFSVLPSSAQTPEEVYPITVNTVIGVNDIPAILQLYGASLASLSQLRAAVGSGFSRCGYGYLRNDNGTIIQALGGQYQEYSWCQGAGLSANREFDDGFVAVVQNSDVQRNLLYAYGIKPPKNEPSRTIAIGTNTFTTSVGSWNEIVANWWNRDKKPANYELYLVYPDDGKPIQIDYSYAESRAIANAYNSTIATIAQARQEIQGGIMADTIYPHWTIMGVLARDRFISAARIVSEAESASPSASGSNVNSTTTTPVPKLELQKLTQSPSSAPPEFGLGVKLEAPGVLLYGPKPAFENREVTIDGRKYRAEFYNTVRNVWSKYELATYKCKTPPYISVTNTTTYGTYARQFVHTLEVSGDGSADVTRVKITGAEQGNRTYPGCNAMCNACEKTTDPYYPKRPLPDLSLYKKWNDQPVKLPVKGDTTDVLEEQMYSVSEAKRSMAIRLVNACRDAGGVVVLSSTERKSYEGCPEGSWCCSPDTDVPLMLPLSSRDPAAATVGKTCEPAEEQCDSSLGPAPLNTDAYSLANRRRGGAVSQAVKAQFCKPKSASVRTTAQERKSIKLLRRALIQ